MEKEISTVPLVEITSNKVIPLKSLLRSLPTNLAVLKELVCPVCATLADKFPTVSYHTINNDILNKEIDDAAGKMERDIRKAMYGEITDKKFIHFTCSRCGNTADVVRWIAASATRYNEQEAIKKEKNKAKIKQARLEEAVTKFNEYLQTLHCDKCDAYGANILKDNAKRNIVCKSCGATLLHGSMYKLEFAGVKLDNIIDHIIG